MSTATPRDSRTTRLALSETALATTPRPGVFLTLTFPGGVLLSFVIWSIAEGFGGPHAAGPTGIGTAIISILVVALLFPSRAGLSPGLGQWPGKGPGLLACLASGRTSRG
jgi:hypothetical protein